MCVLDNMLLEMGMRDDQCSLEALDVRSLQIYSLEKFEYAHGMHPFYGGACYRAD